MAARVRGPGRARGWLVAAILAAVVVTGCDSTSITVIPDGTLGPIGTVGPAVAQTRNGLVRVLGERNLVLQDSEAPFRPPEDTAFTTTPRRLYQVILPDAPSEGFIVVYEFPDPAAAAAAASAQAAYLASGPARVQSAFGARHVMRLVGSTVVLYSWVPDGVEDERQLDIQPALETLGVGVPIPA